MILATSERVPIQTLLTNVRVGNLLVRIDGFLRSGAGNLSLTNGLDVAGDAINGYRHVSAVKTRTCDSHSLSTLCVPSVMTDIAHGRHDLGLKAGYAVVSTRFHLIHSVASSTEECSHV